MNERQPDSQPKDPSTRSLDRRQLLKYLGTAAAGAATYKLGETVLTPRSEEKAEQEFYQDGEIIEDPVARVRIEGWLLLIDLEDINNYLADPDKGRATFMIEGSEVKQIIPLRINSDLKPTDFVTVNRDGRQYLVNSLLPSRTSDTVRVTFAEEAYRSRETKETERTYTIKPVNHHQSYMTNTHILSEVELPEAIFKQIDEIAGYFDPYLKFLRPSVYVLHPVDQLATYNASANSTDNYVTITADSFQKPRYSQDGDDSLFHEMSHCVIRQLQGEFQRHDKGTAAYLDFYRSYETLMQHSRLPLPYYETRMKQSLEEANRSEKSAAFKLVRLFDESTYIDNKDIRENGARAGHPYDRYDELFASTLTVLRFYAVEFVHNYEALPSTDDRKIVRNVVFSALGCLKQLNPDKQAAQILIPDLEYIRTSLDNR